jgi:hypothetical protein
MINITVLKYGTKYSSTYVNNFLKKFKEKTTVNCTFWVQTEDPTGLDDYIKVLPIDFVDPINRRWHKLDLFETSLLTGDCFHFDLDMVIERNIDHYLNYKSDKLVVLYAHYKNPKEVAHWNNYHKVGKKRNPKDGMYNSSIFYWNTNYESHKNIAKRHYEIDDVYDGSFCRFVFWEGKHNVTCFPFRDYNNVLVNGYSKTATINLYNQQFDIVKKYYTNE